MKICGPILTNLLAIKYQMGPEHDPSLLDSAIIFIQYILLLVSSFFGPNPLIFQSLLKLELGNSSNSAQLCNCFV